MSARRSRSWTNIAFAASGGPSYCACAPRPVRSNSATVTFWLPTVMIGLSLLDEQPTCDRSAIASASAAGRDTGFNLQETGMGSSPRRLGGAAARSKRGGTRLAPPSHLLHHRCRDSPRERREGWPERVFPIPGQRGV